MVQDRGPVVEAVTIVMVVIATLFVVARFITRGWIVRSIKQDDWWILGAWLLAVGFSVSICVGCRFGLGMHKSDIPADAFPALRKAEYTFSVLYNPSLMLTKTSIIVFYLSVMSKDVDPVFKWCNWICLAVVNIAGLALTCLNIFQCRPIPAGFEYPTPTTAHCTDIVTLYLSSAPVNIITDIAVLFLPMPILTGMRLPQKQKIILVITFSAGAFVAVVDVIRIAYLQSAAVSRLTSTGDSGRIIDNNDFSWYSSLSFMWSAVEVNIGIICACVPSLKPLFLRFLPSFIKDVNDNSRFNSMDMQYSETNEKGVNQMNNPAAFRQPSTKEYTGDDDGDNMGFLNMLAGPDDDAPLSSNLSRNHTRLSRVSTRRSVASDFDFVTMDKSKNMLKLNNRQSVWPVAVVTVIFFLWGFAYGLLDTLNAQFQRAAGLSTGMSLGLHASYYGGYLVGPLTLGRFMLKRYGFKASMIAGLCVYGCGTLVFWPSAVLTSYTAFVISNFIVAFGLSCLEIAANPYTALCGPLEYAEVRLNLSQAFQAVGTVLSPLLANKVLFKNVAGNANSLLNVQWAYLGISIFVFALAVVFYYITLPEATDDELEEQADKRSATYRANVGPFRVVWVTLALGVFSQWCYVGAQESFGSSAEPIYQLAKPTGSLDPFYWHTVGHTMFAIGRFVTAFLNYLVKPRWILLGCFMGVITTSALQTSLDGDAAITVSMLGFFFEAGIFSIIFAMSMRGMGAHTKTASALMTAAISGGAVFPPIQWVVENLRGLKYSYVVVVAVFAFGSIFPIYLNLIPAAQHQVDPIHETRRDRRARRQLRQDSLLSEKNTARQFGLAGIIARRKKQQKRNPDMPSFQHVERASENPSPMTMATKAPWDSLSIPEIAHFDKPVKNVAVSETWHTLDSQSRGSTKSSSGRLSNTTNSNDEITPVSAPATPSARSTSQGTEALSSGGISSRVSPSNRGDDENVPPKPNVPQRKRSWTEDDDVRDDYHRALRGL